MLAVLRHELRLRARDRSLYVVGLIAPVAIATVMSLAFGSTPQPGAASLAVFVDPSDPRQPAYQAVLDAAVDQGVVDVHATASPAAAEAAVREGQADAALVVTAPSVDAPLGEKRVLAPSEQPVARVVAAAIAEHMARVSGATAGSTASLERLVDREAGGPAARPVSYFGPSMAMVFLFLTVAVGAQSIWTERASGRLARVASMPIGLGAVVAGKVLAMFVIGLASLSAMWVVTALVFDASWGPFAGVVALLLALDLVAVAMTGLVAVVGRSPGQAEAATTLITFGLAVVGGNFVPPDLLPSTLRQLAKLTPNGWALDGFARLARGDGLALLAAPVAAMLAAAVVCTALARLRLARWSPL